MIKVINSYRKFYLIVFSFWTLFLIGLFFIEYVKTKEEAQNLAITEARAHFNKDIALRSWVSLHGGIYVPIDSATPPNPALSQIPE
jgi:hypothetical protein